MGRTYEDMSKQELITLVKRLSMQHEEWRGKALEYAEQPRVTIDDWDKVVGSEHTGPYVTVYFADGSQYIGALRLYKGECNTEFCDCYDECDDCDGECQCLGEDE
tara:strand:+ start:14889 stop:15203 length:315 start_codon:yes stop_codon:yes gene_type:complete